jgi:DNA-binding NarL/FixJ family response regulator
MDPVIQTVEAPSSHLSDGEVSKDKARPMTKNEPEGAHDTFRERVETFAGQYGLTSAEAQILYLLILGMDLPSIAKTIGRTRATVKTHVLNIFSKTATHRQAELVSFFFRTQGN